MTTCGSCCLKFLGDLRQVTMTIDAVSAHIFIGLGIMGTQSQAAPGPTYTRFRVDNSGRRDDASRQGRHETKNCSRGMAARVGNQICSGDPLTIALAQAIDGGFEQGRRGIVMLVPFFIMAYIAVT